MTEAADHPPRKRRGWRLKTILQIGVLLIAAGFAGLYFHSRAEVRRLQQSPSQNAASEAERLVKKVGAHLALPNQKPTVATVENVRKLADQPFFKHAHSGDKVLIYTQSRKAILYRPSEDKIIEVAYLNIKNTEQ